ncbi:zinc finger protein 37-like [Saccostrea cucullata]|uniref:zinc finger protein 37-like n=1 Tax=Saccostrea cuccullata TaxID=36930 RepID=UPI002ED2551F
MVRRTKANRRKKSAKSKKGDETLVQAKQTDKDIIVPGSEDRKVEQGESNATITSETCENKVEPASETCENKVEPASETCENKGEPASETCENKVNSSGKNKVQPADKKKKRKKINSPESDIIKKENAGPTKPFVCEQCPSVLKNAKSYREHMRRIHKEKNHKCKDCGKLFLYECVLREHSLMHTGETPHQCPKCPKKFRTKSNLTRHLIVHGICNDSRALYKSQCDICGKLVRFASNLVAHRKSHGEERPFMCVECGKQFKTKAHLDLHMAYHLDYKPHACETCGKSFHDKSNYKKHLLIHKADKHFKCNICDWAFVRKDQLKMHQRTHTKLSFQCTECDKKFKTEAYFKTHLSQHAMGNNFVCFVCDKVYSSKSNLKMHMKKCHGSSMSVSSTAEREGKLTIVKKEVMEQGKGNQGITVIVVNGIKNELSLPTDSEVGSDEQKIENAVEDNSKSQDPLQQGLRKENRNSPRKDEIMQESLPTHERNLGYYAEADELSNKSEINLENQAILEDNITKLQEMSGKQDITKLTPSIVMVQNNVEPKGEAEDAKIAFKTTLETKVLEADTKEILEDNEMETSTHGTQMVDSAVNPTDTSLVDSEMQPTSTTLVDSEMEPVATSLVDSEMEPASTSLVDGKMEPAVTCTSLVDSELQPTATSIATGVKCIQVYIDGQLCTLTGVQSDNGQNSCS